MTPEESDSRAYFRASHQAIMDVVRQEIRLLGASGKVGMVTAWRSGHFGERLT